MARIGLLAKIYDCASAINQGRQWLDTDGLEHEGRLSYKRGLERGIETFQEALSSAVEDLHTLFTAEYTFLMQELEVCAVQDTKARNSHSKTIVEFDEGYIALEVLKNVEGYMFVDKVISNRPEFRYKGMPKDSFHVACAGHIVRIENILKTHGINMKEKELLKQRQANMKTAQTVYLEMQRKLLTNK